MPLQLAIRMKRYPADQIVWPREEESLISVFSKWAFCGMLYRSEVRAAGKQGACSFFFAAKVISLPSECSAERCFVVFISCSL